MAGGGEGCEEGEQHSSMHGRERLAIWSNLEILEKWTERKFSKGKCKVLNLRQSNHMQQYRLLR